MGHHARVIGLTGTTASGKSAVAVFLAQKGYTIIDVDALGHQALTNQQEAIVATFGAVILDNSLNISRSALGQIVFSDPAKRHQLEALLHPIMRASVEHQIQEKPDGRFVIDAALLYPMRLENLCDKVLVVTTTPLKRLWRLTHKRGVPFLYALKIVMSQRKLVPKHPKNIIIKNEGNLAQLETLINKLAL